MALMSGFDLEHTHERLPNTRYLHLGPSELASRARSESFRCVSGATRAYAEARAEGSSEARSIAFLNRAVAINSIVRVILRMLRIALRRFTSNRRLAISAQGSGVRVQGSVQQAEVLLTPDP